MCDYLKIILAWKRAYKEMIKTKQSHRNNQLRDNEN